ncbi:hypothetical protein A4R29_18985 [Mesorhizobium ciceri biovar biserrulae]|nr:hypothetical protein A4R29_18985 [Mesorhizobium ciceri biovar biserrulae]
MGPARACPNVVIPYVAEAVAKTLVDRDYALDGPPFRRLDELVMSNANRVERTIEFALPILEKTLEFGKGWSEIIVLPDIELKQAWMIGQVIVDFGRRQAITFHLQAEFVADRIGHVFLLLR